MTTTVTVMDGTPEHTPFSVHHISILDRKRFILALLPRLPPSSLGGAAWARVFSGTQAAYDIMLACAPSSLAVFHCHTRCVRGSQPSTLGGGLYRCVTVIITAARCRRRSLQKPSEAFRPSGEVYMAGNSVLGRRL